jgi:hypothetical protein
MCDQRCPCPYIYNHSHFLEELFEGVDESWDGDEAAESIAIDYVRELERRVVALGGSMERWAEVTS